MLNQLLGMPFLDLTAWHPWILADQVTLFKPEEGADYAHHITTWHPRIQNPITQAPWNGNAKYF